MSQLGPEKITTQQRFNRVQEDLDLIYKRLKETADELQASRARVAELERENKIITKQRDEYRECVSSLEVHGTALEVAPDWVCVPKDEWDQALAQLYEP